MANFPLVIPTHIEVDLTQKRGGSMSEEIKDAIRSNLEVVIKELGGEVQVCLLWAGEQFDGDYFMREEEA